MLLHIDNYLFFLKYRKTNSMDFPKGFSYRHLIFLTKLKQKLDEFYKSEITLFQVSSDILDLIKENSEVVYI